MNLKEIKSVLNQDAIPQEMREEVLEKVSVLIKDYDVEVIPDMKKIRIDIYNEKGEKEDTFIYRFL